MSYEDDVAERRHQETLKAIKGEEFSTWGFMGGLIGFIIILWILRGCGL